MKKLFLYSIPGLLLLLASCMQRQAGDDPIKMNDQGLKLIDEGKHDAALRVFLKAVKSSKLSEEEKGTIYRNISLTYNQLGNKDSALHFSTLAVKYFRKNSYDYLISAADVDLLRGKTAAALSKLLKAQEMNASDIAVNNTLGLLYMGEYGEEFTDLDKALVYNLEAFNISGGRIMEEVLALNYYNLENYEKAELHYDQLRQKYPDMINYILNAGFAKYKLKKRKEANELFDEVIIKDSSYQETIDTFIDNYR